MLRRRKGCARWARSQRNLTAGDQAHAKKDELEYPDAPEGFTGLGDSGTLRFVCNTSRCRLMLRMCVIVARTRDSIKEHL
jgi:hypothetical protein